MRVPQRERAFCPCAFLSFASLFPHQDVLHPETARERVLPIEAHVQHAARNFRIPASLRESHQVGKEATHLVHRGLSGEIGGTFVETVLDHVKDVPLGPTEKGGAEPSSAVAVAVVVAAVVVVAVVVNVAAGPGHDPVDATRDGPVRQELDPFSGHDHHVVRALAPGQEFLRNDPLAALRFPQLQPGNPAERDARRKRPVGVADEGFLGDSGSGGWRRRRRRIAALTIGVVVVVVALRRIDNVLGHPVLGVDECVSVAVVEQGVCDRVDNSQILIQRPCRCEGSDRLANVGKEPKGPGDAVVGFGASSQGLLDGFRQHNAVGVDKGPLEVVSRVRVVGSVLLFEDLRIDPVVALGEGKIGLHGVPQVRNDRRGFVVQFHHQVSAGVVELAAQG
mmetsp:Transcript_6523/g.18726  ORF Transcript_6523/g.18726 Transcript_6523/m.18726 type:complete len:393 (-) Transcript_6523:65-1243(-)